MKTFFFALLMLPILAQAQIIQPTTNITDAAPGPSFTWTGTFTAFSNNAGTPSLPQQRPWVASNVTGTLTITPTSGQGMEVSPDGVTYSSSLTGITGTSGIVWMRTAAATTAGNYSGTLVATGTGINVSTPFTSTVTNAGSNSDTARFAMSLTSQTVPTGFVSFFGDPVTGVRTATNTAGTITISTVSTANWALVTSNAANDADGKTGSTVAGFPDNILRAQMFTYSGTSHLCDSATQTLAKPNFNITGLNTGATYHIEFTACLDDTRFGLTCMNKFRAKGVNATADIAVNPDGTNGQFLYSTTLGNLPRGALGNTAKKVVISSITPDGTGKVSIYLFTESGEELGIISGLTIWKN